MLESSLSSKIQVLHSSAKSRIFSLNPICFSEMTTSQDLSRTGVSPFADAALCNLLFKTSAGAQTVVAIVPAANDAATWTRTPSETFMSLFERIFLFADVYLKYGQRQPSSVVSKHTLQSAKRLTQVSLHSCNGRCFTHSSKYFSPHSAPILS
jgi:hypothetical protein